jgi:uncharacterized protein
LIGRRTFFGWLGLGAASALQTPRPALRAPAPPVAEALTPEGRRLYATIVNYPMDDTHCHPISDKDSMTTPEQFLERLALAAFPAPSYFPPGVLRQWKEGSAAVKTQLNRQYGIDRVLAEIHHHFKESVFVKFMIKEMAGFLGCPPNLNAVVEARNDRGRRYWTYVSDLFRDVKLANVMVDTGFTDGMQADGINRFADAIKPAEMRAIARVEVLQRDLLQADLGFEELETRFVDAVRKALDADGNYGRKSYGMKSYLLPRIGPIKPIYDAAAAKRSWEEYKRTRQSAAADREADSLRGKELLEYLLTLAMEECLARDMPMQFHAGDGEAPGIILRNQHPYFLEEVVRFDRNGVMRMPKVIPIHAGYPLVGEAAWLSHLYTNCYFELSLMTPFIHQGLSARYLQIMEAVPLSKILFGSDAYNVPELYWLAGRWGKRFLSQALGVYLKEKILTEPEALDAAKMILFQNNRRVYNLAT